MYGRRAIDVGNLEGWIDVHPIDGLEDITTAHVHLYGSGAFRVPWQENDWITNFAACSVAGVVHLGYLVAAMRLIRDIRGDIRGARYVGISGHSMGGSVAEVAGALIAAGKTDVHPIVFIDNYGGPAPFRRKLHPMLRYGLERIGRATWYVAGNDPVPYLMPWNHHIGLSMRFSTGSRDPIDNHINGYNKLIQEHSE